MTTLPVADEHDHRLKASFSAIAVSCDALRFLQVSASRFVEVASLAPGARVSDLAMQARLKQAFFASSPDWELRPEIVGL